MFNILPFERNILNITFRQLLFLKKKKLFWITDNYRVSYLANFVYQALIQHVNILTTI